MIRVNLLANAWSYAYWRKSRAEAHRRNRHNPGLLYERDDYKAFQNWVYAGLDILAIDVDHMKEYGENLTQK